MKRREFLKAAGSAGVGLFGANILAAGTNTAYQPPQQGSAVDGFSVAPLSKVRVAVIGVGARGSGHVGHLSAIDGVEVKAVCDLYQDWADRAVKRVTDAGHDAPETYVGGDLEYRKMLDRDDIDAVFIATPWEWHTPMAVDAMNRGKHAFIEVPAAITIEECWELVDVAEKNQVHCMMMENVNYFREELMVLNMCRQGIFGDLIHGEAAYIHDLRGQMHQVERGTGSWRTPHYQKRNGNLYPTHGLGPVAQYMNINRGDRMDYMSSISSKSKVRAVYAKQNFPADHKWNTGFECGDINTTIVRTVMGRSMMIQWDENSPRPYTRHNMITGTRGLWAGFPGRITIEGRSPSTHSYEQGDDLKKWYDEYEHPLWRKQGELAQKMGGHGGGDFLMIWRIIYCLRNGEPLDQDVYDAAAWSCIFPLSEYSVANRGASVDIPDFTRGKWKTMKPLGIVE